MRLFGAKEPASVRWQRADSLILLGLPTDKQRHADRARCRAPNLTTAQESTESGDSLAEQHDWRAAFDMVSVTQSGCFVRICLGVGMRVTVFGELRGCFACRWGWGCET